MTDENKPVPAFTIDPAPTIEWPVTVDIPVDGGASAAFQFTGVFKRLPEAELDKLLGVDVGAIHESPEAPEAEAKEKRIQDVLRENAELFPQLLVGWEGVKTASGADAEFSAESLKVQITGANGRFLSIGLWRAVSEIRHGARLGN